MKINRVLSESFECIKINGILRNLSNDEMKLYKRAKKEGKLFKSDLQEFDQTVATNMVVKGLLRRTKSKEDGRIYYTTRGRKGCISPKEYNNGLPPDRDITKWISKNKKTFKDRYGDGYEKYLYKKAWKKYNDGMLSEASNPTALNFSTSNMKPGEFYLVSFDDGTTEKAMFIKYNHKDKVYNWHEPTTCIVKRQNGEEEEVYLAQLQRKIPLQGEQSSNALTANPLNNNLTESIYFQAFNKGDLIKGTNFPKEWIKSYDESKITYYIFKRDTDWCVTSRLPQDLSETSIYFRVNPSIIKTGMLIHRENEFYDINETFLVMEDILGNSEFFEIMNTKTKETTTVLTMEIFKDMLNGVSEIVTDGDDMSEPEDMEFDESANNILTENNNNDDMYRDVLETIEKLNHEYESEYDKLRKFAQAGYTNGRLYNHDSQYSDLIDNFFQNVRQAAFDSDDFNVYEENEYDSEATWEKIRGEDISYLWDRYSDTSEILDTINEKIIDTIKNEYNIEKYLEKEPEWDGDDKSNSNEEHNQSDSDDEILKDVEEQITFIDNVNELSEKIRNNNGDLSLKEEMFSLLDDYYRHSSVIDDEYIELRDSIQNDANNSGDYDVFVDGDLDIDETWNKIYDEYDMDLVSKYGYSSDITELFMEIIELCKNELKEVIQDEEPTIIGSEWDESNEPFNR